MLVEFDEFERKRMKADLSGGLVFASVDEERIKNSISNIKKKYISKDFEDLNYYKFDGSMVQKESIINACETLPFMSEKKLVVIYRADFLRGSTKDDKNGLGKFIIEYLSKVPNFCILIIYCVLETKREKISDRVKKLEAGCLVVKDDKNRRDVFERRIKEIIEAKGGDADRVLVSLIASVLPNDTGVIENEIEKLLCYTLDRKITKEDVYNVFKKSSDDDVFDMVDKLSTKQPEKALLIFNKLMNNGEKGMAILNLIERQFRIMFYMKIGKEEGKGKNDYVSKFKLNPYICEKNMKESEKFPLEILKRNLSLCVMTEKRLKSVSSDEKLEIESLIIRLSEN